MDRTPGIVLHGAARSPPIKVAPPSGDQATHPLSHKPNTYFATPEHRKLGNSIELAWPTAGNTKEPPRLASGSSQCSFEFNILDKTLNSLELNYGDISSMAGDFYGTYHPISDGTDLEDRVQRFLESWNLLAREKGSVAEYAAIMKVDNKDEVEKLGTAPATEPPSEVYSKMDALQMTKEWYDATNDRTVANGYSQEYPGYLGLVVTNWDHFGEDAHKSYIAGHTAALRHASSGKGDVSALKLAYAMNAFADHFLQDSFSAGHLRTPRRQLHNVNLNLEDPNWDPFWQLSEEIGNLTLTNLAAFLVKFRPEVAKQLPLADLCSNLMHDEESAIGLQVTNKRGDSWLCVGDDYLDDVPAGVDTKKYCIEAVQKSADEIYEAWTSGQVISEDAFGALQIVPSVSAGQKLAPLFKVNDEGEVERRGAWLLREAFQWPPWDWNIKRTDHEDYVANFGYLATYVECFLSGKWKWPVKLSS